MIKLAYCTCGCGALKRAPLPPRAAGLRNRRLIAEKKAEIRAKYFEAVEAARLQALEHVHVGGMQ